MAVQPYTKCEAGSFAAYPGDCTQYLNCLFGTYEIFQCAPGLHWNSVSWGLGYNQKSIVNNVDSAR